MLFWFLGIAIGIAFWYQKGRFAKLEAHMTDEQRGAAEKLRNEKQRRLDKIVWIVIVFLAVAVFIATQVVRNIS